MQFLIDKHKINTFILLEFFINVNIVPFFNIIQAINITASTIASNEYLESISVEHKESSC